MKRKEREGERERVCVCGRERETETWINPNEEERDARERFSRIKTPVFKFLATPRTFLPRRDEVRGLVNFHAHQRLHRSERGPGVDDE